MEGMEKVMKLSRNNGFQRFNITYCKHDVGYRFEA